MLSMFCCLKDMYYLVIGACGTEQQYTHSYEYSNTSCFLLSFVLFYPLSISGSLSEMLGHGTLWCLLAQVPSHPRFATVLSKPLVMATLAPAVVACAHSRPPSQSLSHPIYLTQTRASRPSPAYLSSAWFSLGVRKQPSATPPWQL